VQKDAHFYHAAQRAVPVPFCLIGIALALGLTSCVPAGKFGYLNKEPLPSDSPRLRASFQKLKNADPNNRVTVAEVEAIAKEADKGFADGWIDGRDARVFKSYYRALTPLQKAQFAMAYHDLVEKSDQNLGQSYKTYIPYKTRAAFARHYWETSELGPKFTSEIEKMQIAWIHESLLDGSELWWRAAENRFGNAIDSATQMAHDVEQNMVSKYMEDEATESTFSQQMSIKKPANQWHF
jgi:hypothetical protein